MEHITLSIEANHYTYPNACGLLMVVLRPLRAIMAVQLEHMLGANAASLHGIGPYSDQGHDSTGGRAQACHHQGRPAQPILAGQHLSVATVDDQLKATRGERRLSTWSRTQTKWTQQAAALMASTGKAAPELAMHRCESDGAEAPRAASWFKIVCRSVGH